VPEMYVFAGCNGSGKSTLIEQIGVQFANIINPDHIAKQLKPNDPRSVDLSAGKEAIKEIRKCFERSESFALETTLSGQFVIRQMKIAKESGYKVYLYYIGLQDVQLHIDRVNTRVKEGGHFIETDVILRRYDLSLANMKDALLIADTSVILDNSDEEFEILIEMKNGEIKYQTKFLPQWLKGIEL
jgi:predicted ABC-type ATPase